jgi:hypothetical protein
MNFKEMLETLSQLSEATKETGKGRVHTAEPGGYGRKFDTDEEGDEKKDKAPAVKRGRGRPKKGADDSGEVKKYDNAKALQSFMIGNVPKKSKELEKLPKKKHSLKEYFDALDASINEAEQLTIEPAKQNTQVIKQGSQVIGSVTNPTLAATIKSAIGKGEMTLAGDKLGEGDDDYSAKKARAGKDIGKPGKAFAQIAKKAAERYGSEEKGKKVAGAILAKLRAKTNEADQPPNDSLSSPLTMEAKTKPDYIDLDKDGNKKESMKKAASDAKQDKKKVNESMHKHTSARLLGKAHALAKEGYNCKYEDMEEAKCYHEGYKEGLDECYGKGVYEAAPATPPATVGGMANQAEDMAMEDEFGEGNLFTGNLAKARAAGKSHADLDGDGDLEKVSEFAMAFENWDNQLNQLLTENEKVEEGMTVSISKGQQGMPDSVSVSAQDQEADALLGLIKQAGLGLFGGEDKPNLGLMPAHDHEPAEIGAQGDNIDVVGDHDGMMALIKKVTGGHDSDYADEEGDHGHDHEEPCEACGESSCKCDEESEMVEDETLDQREEEVAEDLTTDPQADEEAEAEEDKALATVDAAQDAADKEEQVTEWANDAGQDTSDEQTMMDPDFMMNTITSGLNKKKRDVGGNGQSTVPVTVVRTNESVDDWMRLAGIK